MVRKSIRPATAGPVSPTTSVLHNPQPWHVPASAAIDSFVHQPCERPTGRRRRRGRRRWALPVPGSVPNEAPSKQSEAQTILAGQRINKPSTWNRYLPSTSARALIILTKRSACDITPHQPIPQQTPTPASRSSQQQRGFFSLLNRSFLQEAQQLPASLQLCDLCENLSRHRQETTLPKFQSFAQRHDGRAQGRRNAPLLKVMCRQQRAVCVLLGN